MSFLASTELLLRLTPTRVEGRLRVRRLPWLPWVAEESIERTLENQMDVGDAITDICNVLRRHTEPKRATAVISDAYCRYFILRRPTGARNRRELDIAVEARFRQIYQQEPEDWRIVADRKPWAQADLVCAMPAALHQGICAGLAKAGLALQSLQPLWVCCANDGAALQRQGRHWVASGDAHALTIGLFDRGTCVGVRSRPMQQDRRTALMREIPLFATDSEMFTRPSQTWLYGGLTPDDWPSQFASGVANGAIEPAWFGSKVRG